MIVAPMSHSPCTPPLAVMRLRQTKNQTIERKLKPYFYLVISILLISCGNKSTSKSDNSDMDKHKADSLASDSILTYSYQNNFSHSSIINNSDRQIDLLYNSIDKYLGGKIDLKVRFKTECLTCEPIQEYAGGLLFAKQLLITNDQIKYFKNDINIDDSINPIKLISDKRDKTNPKFTFSNGKGSIKYLGISCNDADFNKVQLKYTSGEIVIDSLINAAFFEYDLNTDGEKEQFLIGSRCCIQEFIILRIGKPRNAE